MKYIVDALFLIIFPFVLVIYFVVKLFKSAWRVCNGIEREAEQENKNVEG